MKNENGWTRKEYIEFWYSDLNNLFNKHFQCEFDLGEILDYPSQDSYYKLEVPTYRDWEEEWNEEKQTYVNNPNKSAELRAQFAEGNTSDADLEALMDLLHEDGVIPAGEYLITIWW